MGVDTKDRKNLSAVNLGLAANMLLAGLKTSVGIVGHSPALLADGINSTSDVAYMLFVRALVRLARKPPDREHPYGHHHFDTIAAVVVGAFVITTGVAVFMYAVNGVYEMLSGQVEFEGPRVVALWVALVSVAIKVALAVFTGRIARETQSFAVLALARDHRNDVFSIATVTLGIVLGRTGYAWVDPLAAAVVALIIFYTGVTILRESSASLMDVRPDAEIVRRIRELLDHVPGVEEVEEVRANCLGPYLLVSVTLGIDGSISVADGDRIASRAEDALWKHVDYLRQVSIHYHPHRREEGRGRQLHSPGGETTLIS
jgi:cation diffusion facilitator family transporter